MRYTNNRRIGNPRRPLRTNASRLNSSVFDYDFNPKDDCYIVIDTVNDNYAVMSSVEAVDDFLYTIADTHDIADVEQFVKDVYNDKDPDYRLVQGLRY